MAAGDSEDAESMLAPNDSGSAEFVPAPSAALVRDCAHDAWAPRLRAHTYCSETVEMSQVCAKCCAWVSGALHRDARACPGQEFVSYLLEDGVRLASDSAAVRPAPLLKQPAAALFALV